ncbi:MAG: potassium channel family protein [Actinomycetota bacterium]
MIGDIEPHHVTRREIGATAVLALASAVAIIVAYAVLPFAPDPREAIWPRLLAGITVFTIVLGWQARSIARHERPLRRAVVALGILVPLFIVIYAANYVTMSRSDPTSFNRALSKTQGIYFTVTVLSTVGFGDIVPKTDPARLLVTSQMILNFVLIGGVVRLIVGLGSREAKRRQAPGAELTADLPPPGD